MELTPLRYILAIARHGHMTRAAEALGVTQPALSAMLRKLETELGVELFDRGAKGVTPTAAGAVFLDHAEQALRRVDAGVDAVRALAGLEAGSIRVGGGATAVAHLLPPVVRHVRAQHPALRFYVREAGSSAVAQAVLSGELDLGIVTTPVQVPGSGDLIEVDTFDDELCLLVPQGWQGDRSIGGRGGRGGGGGFRWADLDGEPVIAFEAGSAVREVIDHAAGASGVTLNVVMELRSIESIQRMVEAGVGVGFVSRLAVDDSKNTTTSAGHLGRGVGEGQAGLTRVLSCGDARITRRLAVVRRNDRQPSHAAAAFESALVAELRNRRTPYAGDS